MTKPKKPYKFKIEATDGTQIELNPAYILFAKQHKDTVDAVVKITGAFLVCCVCGKNADGGTVYTVKYPGRTPLEKTEIQDYCKEHYKEFFERINNDST